MAKFKAQPMWLKIVIGILLLILLPTIISLIAALIRMVVGFVGKIRGATRPPAPKPDTASPDDLKPVQQ